MNLKHLGIFLFFYLTSSICFSQFGNSFFEERIAEGIDDNTAIVITLPSVNTTLYNGGFTYGDIYEADTKTLNIVTAADFDQDFNLLVSARASYGGVSIQRDAMTYSLNHEWTANANVNIPKSLFDIIVDGNAQFANSNFRINPSFQYLTLHRWSLGAAYTNDRIHFGGQLHFYQGEEAIYGKQFEINITAEEDFFDLIFDKNIEVMSSGILNYQGIEDIEFIGNSSVFSPVPFTKNFGIGASLEVAFDITDELKLFGRIDDIGSITWKDQSVTYSDKSETFFDGIDIRDAYVNEEPYSLKDTLYDLLTIDESVGSFSGGLPISLLVGLNYSFDDQLDVGIIYRGKQTSNALQSLLQIHGGYAFSDHIAIKASNTLLRGSFINPGFGLRWKIGNAFNLYLDTINPWKFGKYYDSNLLHLNFGTYITL